MIDIGRIREVARGVWTPTRLDVAVYGTPLLLLVNGRGDAAVTLIGAVSLLLVVRSSTLRQAGWFWLVVAVAVGVAEAQNFLLLDDHVVLTTYWCAALGFGLLARERERTLVLSATLLIGLLFAFAAMWKLTSGQFDDGRFFRFTLVWDDRFEHLETISGQTNLEDHREALASVLNDSRAGGEVLWPEGPRSRAVALVMTWWGIVTEAAAALGFLLPLRRRPWLRDVALVTFMVTTYLIVPIAGFAAVLAVMAAVRSDDPRWRRAYVATAAAFVLVWTPVWHVTFG